MQRRAKPHTHLVAGDVQTRGSGFRGIHLKGLAVIYGVRRHEEGEQTLVAALSHATEGDFV